MSERACFVTVIEDECGESVGGRTVGGDTTKLLFTVGLWSVSVNIIQ